MKNTPIILATFALPVILIEIVNIVVAIRIYFTLKARVRTVSSESKDARRRVRTMFGVASLLGLTFIFGAATLFDVDATWSQRPCYLLRVFHYLFAICNSLQGLFIFVFTVLLSSDARKSIVRCLRRDKVGKGKDRRLLAGDLDKGQRSTLTTGMSTLPGKAMSSDSSQDSCGTSVSALPKQPFEISEEADRREAETAALYWLDVLVTSQGQTTWRF